MQVLTRSDAAAYVRARSASCAHAARTNPFASSEWVLHFIDQIAEPDWRFVVPESRSSPGSFMLLYTTGTSKRWSAATNYYASLYSPMASPLDGDRERATALAEIVDDVADARPRCAVVNLAPLDPDAPETSAVQHLLSERGFYVRRYFCFGNWYLPCEGLSFDEFIKGRDSQLRNTFARKAKRFKPGNPDGARLAIVTEPADVDAAMAAYDAVYARSWKKPEPYPDFVRTWAAICARRGWLRLGVAWAGDVPIAAQLWFVMNRRAFIFKLAYDDAYTQWSAGTVLSAHLFRHALDADRVVEIDYLTGDDAYKRQWMTSRRDRVGLVACNSRTTTGLILAAREFSGDVRHRLRKQAERGTDNRYS
jgi:hypothetical protein